MTDFVLPDELLARYITSSRWYRRADQTVKQDAFIPPENPLELSTTRHLNLSENEIWDIGNEIVSGQQNRKLHGRADVEVSHVTSQSLNVVADPTTDNPSNSH